VSPVRLLLATRNAKKLVELRRILASSAITGVQVIGLDHVPPFPEAPETAATFEENALAKARDAAAATGLPAVADDSGLEVDALNGMPGVLSARWAGRHGDDAANLQLVLDQLADIPEGRRGAAFVCAAALVVPSGTQIFQTVVRGHWRGTLSCAARGSHGFGYDPIFVPEGGQRTSAELDPAEKDVASHRGQALRALLPAVRQLLDAQRDFSSRPGRPRPPTAG
jgi:XTP/dITP diphosphohydrolase